MAKRKKKQPTALPNLYRQGDVLLMAVEHIPSAAKVQPECVVAHGEVTGHTHRIERGAARYVEDDEEEDAPQQWLLVFHDAAELVHEEHPALTLPSGRYRVIQQRSYVPEELPDVQD